jgi:tetratricopeptide (TPR) repeat protein
MFSPKSHFTQTLLVFGLTVVFFSALPCSIFAQHVERATDQNQNGFQVTPEFFLSDDLDTTARKLYGAAHEWPEYAEVYDNLGGALANLGDIDGALGTWPHMQQLHPSAIPNHYTLSALVSYNYGVTLLQKGELDRALTEWQLALRLQPAFPEVHYGIGLAQLVRGNLPQAIDSFQEALTYASSWPQAQYQLGMAFYLDDALPQAIEAWEQALTLNPLYAKAQSNIGLAHLKAGDARLALEAFDKALRIDPTLPQAHFNRGLALAHLAHWHQALSSFQETLRLQPTFAPTFYALGLSFQTIGRPGQAEEVWRKGLRLRPPAHQAAVIHAHLGDLSWQHGQASTALREYQQSLVLQPNQTQVHFRMGAIYMVMRDWANATFALQQAHHLDPTWPQPLINLGETLYQQGNHQEAVRTYEQALALAPDHVTLHVKLGMTLRALNQPAQALAHLHFAAQSGIGEAQDLLGSMYANGSGIPQNLPVAIQWWGRAATSSTPEVSAHARDELSQLRSLIFLQPHLTSLHQEILEGFALIQQEIRDRHTKEVKEETEMSAGKMLIEDGNIREGLQILLHEAYALHPRAHHELENLFPLVETRNWAQEKHQLLAYFQETAQEGNRESCQFLQHHFSSSREFSDSAHLVEHTGHSCHY